MRENRSMAGGIQGMNYFSMNHKELQAEYEVVKKELLEAPGIGEKVVENILRETREVETLHNLIKNNNNR